MNDRPFDFVTNSLYRKKLKLDPISRTTLLKYLEKLWLSVETKIKGMIPNMFDSFSMVGLVAVSTIYCYICYVVR